MMKTGCDLPGKHNYESTLLTDMDLKAVNEEVKCCVEDTSRTDEPTVKRRKYITPTLPNSVRRLASTLRRTALLGISALLEPTLVQRL